MTGPALAPCPFCGSSDTAIFEMGGGGLDSIWFGVDCCQCGGRYSGPTKQYSIMKPEASGKAREEARDAAIEAWNRRVLSGVELPGWRTIDSAPKDGSRFLVLCRDAVFVAFYKANRLPNAVQPVTLQVMARPGFYSAASGWLEPTHWMPLPSPPQPQPASPPPPVTGAQKTSGEPI